MKKVLLTLLAVIVILGALAGAGYAGYRIGYSRGISTDEVQFLARPERTTPYFMPRLDRDYNFRVLPYHTPMMRGDFGFSIFSPFRLLWNVAILALVIWFVYWLFSKSGWRLTREPAVTPAEVPPAKTEG